MRAKYILSEVLTGLWRNVTMTVAMIITMSVSLTMLGAGVLLYWQVNEMERIFFTKVEVSIFLSSDVTEDQRSSLKTDLEKNPLVQSVQYVSREQAYDNFKQLYRDAPDLVESVKSDTLPESFRVKLRDPTKFQAVSDQYHDRQGIDEIIDQRQVLGKVFKILNSVQNLSILVAVFQGVAALLLVANTIQVAAYSKRREVAVMKLVGASNWFIQAPFVLEAVFAGVLGALLGFLFLVGLKWFVIDGSLRPLATLLAPVPWSRILLMLPLLAGVGSLISAGAGWLTLRFYVRV